MVHTETGWRSVIVSASIEAVPVTVDTVTRSSTSAGGPIVTGGPIVAGSLPHLRLVHSGMLKDVLCHTANGEIAGELCRLEEQVRFSNPISNKSKSTHTSYLTLSLPRSRSLSFSLTHSQAPCCRPPLPVDTPAAPCPQWIDSRGNHTLSSIHRRRPESHLAVRIQVQKTTRQ